MEDYFKIKLLKIIESNFKTVGSSEQNEKYKVGTSKISDIEELIGICDQINDVQAVSLFKYVKNLLLIDPEPFPINDSASLIFKVLANCSYNNFKGCYDLLRDYSTTKMDFIGASAKTKVGHFHTVEVVDFFNKSHNKKQYKDKEYEQIDHYIPERLEIVDFTFLYVKAIEISKCEENEILRKIKITSLMKFILNYIGQTESQEQFLIAAFKYLYTLEIGDFIDDMNLEKINYDFSEELINCKFEFPLIPIFEAKHAVGIARMRNYEFVEAYEKDFKFYNFYSERIDCLIKAKKLKLADFEIKNNCYKLIKETFIDINLKNFDQKFKDNFNNFFDSISNSFSFIDQNIEKTLIDISLENDCCLNADLIECLNDFLNEFTKFIGENEQLIALFNRGTQMILSSLFTKLGHIHQNTIFYDIAYVIYKNIKPLQAKALLLYQLKKYEECAETCKEMLAINPELPEVNFNYGCCLMELNNFVKAAKIFKKLRDEDHMNVSVVQNLSFCYYKLSDVNKMLKTLKTVALSDQNALKQYLLMSIKNSLQENIKWALKHIVVDKMIEEAIFYILQNQIVSTEELKEVLSENRYIDKQLLSNIFNKF
ncbi:hypothetical protein NUSPORA_02258 [Nucleospora cyclopteri]